MTEGSAERLPEGWRSRIVATNGIDLHVVTAGPDDGPVMVMLHGFPEYWTAWAQVARRFADRWRLILPDQRGFGRSAAPQGVAAYDTKHMVADLAALLDALAPGRKIVLCGHDWGASVAYAFAMRHADRVDRLIIANGVHPVCFQKALLAGGAQTDASQYMNILRAEGIEQRLSENGFARLLSMFEKFSAAPWLDEATRRAYRAAWSGEGRLSAMLNWYRASPMAVPESGTPAKPLPIRDEMREKYRITMPHLLLWGMQDTALLPEARADLAAFCDDLTVQEFDDASHWILHEKPDDVAAAMKGFLGEEAG